MSNALSKSRVDSLGTRVIGVHSDIQKLPQLVENCTGKACFLTSVGCKDGPQQIASYSTSAVIR